MFLNTNVVSHKSLDIQDKMGIALEINISKGIILIQEEKQLQDNFRTGREF